MGEPPSQRARRRVRVRVVKTPLRARAGTALAVGRWYPPLAASGRALGALNTSRRGHRSGSPLKFDLPSCPPLLPGGTRDGELPAVKRGRRQLIPLSELRGARSRDRDTTFPRLSRRDRTGRADAHRPFARSSTCGAERRRNRTYPPTGYAG